MATVTSPIILDSTGQDIKNSIDLLTANINRTASNIPYDNNLTIKGKIDEVDGKIATTRYLKKTEASGNTFNFQAKLNTWHRIMFANSIYNLTVTSSFSTFAFYNIGGGSFNASFNQSTGIATFTSGTDNIRNNTNVLIEEIPI